jgi:hypothetical protein
MLAFWYLGFFSLHHHVLYENKWNMMLLLGLTALTKIMLLMSHLTIQFIRYSECALGYYNKGGKVTNVIFTVFFPFIATFLWKPASQKNLPDQLYWIPYKIQLATVAINVFFMAIVLVQPFLFACEFPEQILYVLLFVGPPMNLVLEAKGITNQSLKDSFFRKHKLIVYVMMLLSIIHVLA